MLFTKFPNPSLRVMLVHRGVRRTCAYSTLSSSSPNTVTGVGFIGLGQMGLPMALNLAKATPNSPFTICDPNPVSIRAFLEAVPQARVVDTPKQVAQSSDLIVSMLPASAHVKSVYLDRQTGIVAASNFRGRKVVCIDSSTIDVETCKNVGNSLSRDFEHSVTFVDAPVSGGVNGAKAGTLTFMVGGRERDFTTIKPTLLSMGRNIVHCGPLSHGLIAKICNNMLLGISMIAASEAMSLGVNLGMDPKLLADIINTSSGQCWSTEKYNPCPGVMEGVPAAREYTGGFGMSLMSKDMGLALESARKTGTSTPLGQASAFMYASLSEAKSEYKSLDFSAVYQYLRSQK